MISAYAELPVRSTCCSWGFEGEADAEEGSERGMAGTAAVEAEGELVEIGLEVLAAQAMVDAEARVLMLEKKRWVQRSTCGRPSGR